MRALQICGCWSANKTHFLGSTVFSSNLIRVLVLAAAGVASTVPAGAAVYWTNDDPMLPREIMVPEAPPHRASPKPRRANTKIEKALAGRENAKPVGPLVISISIERQTLRLFDANGLFAESPVSTGMRGHSTPMGVFSIIQKNKWHRSNIYSGAPMPYMQRITWSGIALHAGVVPGHPASHGCIRMPNSFAIKMWGWTRMGARVIITPGEISPANFANPLLPAQKSAPVAAVEAKDAVATAKAEKAPVETRAADLGLKPSSSSDRTRTADASSATLSLDKPMLSDAVATKPPPPTVDAAKSDDKVLLTRRDVDAAIARSVELPAPVDKAPIEAATPVPTTTQPTKPPAESVAAAPAKKDETRPADAIKAEAAPTVEPAPKRTGQIAVLISARDNKLYVRQNFAPLFETPITIKPSDRPLGTHVFTVRLDKDDARTLRWSAVSLPSVPRHADETDNVSRRRKSTGAIEVKAKVVPDNAEEALDRLTIPADAAAQIADALATGGSIIVSDQGLAAGGETGLGTEFVVPLR